jgi:hypothetical protein
MSKNYHFTIGNYTLFSFDVNFEDAIKETHNLINSKSKFVITYKGENNYSKLKELFDAVDSEYLFNNGYQLYGLSCELKNEDEYDFKKYLAKKRIDCYEN